MCLSFYLTLNIQTFEKYTNCAEITLNAHTIKVSHTCSISYWHCQRICSKHPPLTSIQARRCVSHLLIDGRVLYFPELGIVLPHRVLGTVCFLEQVTTQFISPDRTVLRSTQWTTLSVVSPNGMSTRPVQKCQWTEAAYVRCLVYGMKVMEYGIINSAINESTSLIDNLYSP